MPSYEFTGPDPIDHFVLGRVAPGDVVDADALPGVAPGDVVDADALPGVAWKPAKSRSSRSESDEQASPRTEHGSDTPDAPEEA